MRDERTGGAATRTAGRWGWPGVLVWAALTAALPLGARSLAGPQGAVIHVRWQRDVAAAPAARQPIEARFQLAAGEPLDDTTWRYLLRDPSSRNVRAIVAHPAVEDTHHLDRRGGTVAASAPRTPRPGRLLVGGDAAVRIADALALVLAALCLFVVAAGWAGGARTWRAAWALARGRTRRGLSRAGRPLVLLAGWLSRGIPEVDARTAGIFRIVFGLAVLTFFATHPEDILSLTAMFEPLVHDDVHAAVLDWLRARPSLVNALTPWLLATGAAFTAGLLTRLTYPLFVAGVIVWAYIAVAHDSTHPNSTLVVTLVALLPSRWGDACSVDAWMGKRRAGPPGRRYGYSVWVPGLVFGVAFAAAAVAKLDRAGLDWVLNGSVKYHFITDSFNAPVQWGLTLAGSPWLAVLASLGALLTELLVITAAFQRSERYRAAMGAAGLALLGGFWLFMGVFWPAWWILFLGFLPWQRMSESPGGRSAAPASAVLPARATAAQVAAAVLVLGQQVVVSTLAVERAPMFTHYPMYSWTFPDTDAFDASMEPYYRIVVATTGGEIELACNASEDLVETFREALAGSEDAAARVWAAVRGCRRGIAGVREVTLEGDRRVFDWERLTFTTARAAEVLGPLPAYD